MKYLVLLIISAGLLAFVKPVQTDEGKKLPSVNLKDLEGNAVNTADLSNDGKPIVIAFWGSWCKHCKLELNTIADVYEDWQTETGVKVIAVSVDDQKTVSSVESVVNAAGWEYEVWLDTNGEFKRAMGVNQTPHSFLLDGEGNIVYSKPGFAPGDEEVLYEEILKLTE